MKRVVMRDGLLVDCPQRRQFEHGCAERVDGDAQFKLVDRFIDIRASLRELSLTPSARHLLAGAWLPKSAPSPEQDLLEDAAALLP